VLGILIDKKYVLLPLIQPTVYYLSKTNSTSLECSLVFSCHSSGDFFMYITVSTTLESLAQFQIYWTEGRCLSILG